MKMLQQHMLEQHGRHLCNICIKVSFVLTWLQSLQFLPVSRKFLSLGMLKRSAGNIGLPCFCIHKLNGSLQT